VKSEKQLQEKCFSLAPGFSPVTTIYESSRKPFKRFPFLARLGFTGLKPGVNESRPKP
jgi:hypothetical protein